jgi:cytidylate kinase
MTQTLNTLYDSYIKSKERKSSFNYDCADASDYIPSIITFAGIPGSGKTTLALYLEKHLPFMRISNDDFRGICQVKNISVTSRDIVQLMGEYITSPHAAQHIILDASIDRKFREVEIMSQQKQMKHVTIVMQSEIATIRPRLQKRDGSVLFDLKHMIQQHKIFLEEYDGLKINYFEHPSKRETLTQLQRMLRRGNS